MALTYIGGEIAQSSLGLPAASIQAFQGMLLFFLLAVDLLTNFKIKWAKAEVTCMNYLLITKGLTSTYNPKGLCNGSVSHQPNIACSITNGRINANTTRRNRGIGS